MAWDRIAVAFGIVALVGCARDNPFFEDSSTDGVGESSTTKPDSASSLTGPDSNSNTSASTTGNNATEHATTDNSSATEPVGTSDDASFSATDVSTGVASETGATDTEACTPTGIDAMLAADAFLVSLEDCKMCSNANYGASEAYDLFQDTSGIAYYVARFDNLPFDKPVLEATLTTNVEALAIGYNAMVEVHEFWPGCDWPEGTRNGPGMVADGITWNECDAVANLMMPGGSATGAFGAQLADPAAADENLGPNSVTFELDADLVQSWLDNDGHSLLLRAPVDRSLLLKPARESKSDGALQLSFVICD